MRIFSQTSSKTSFSAGEVMTRIVSRTRKATPKSSAGASAELGLVEPADPLGVDQPLADPQPGEEGRGHAAALAVEELDQVEVGADGDDQRRPLLEGHQHRHVLAGAGGGDDRVRQPGIDQALAARARGRRDRRGRSARRRRRAPRRWPSPCRRGSRRASARLPEPRRRRRRRRRSAAARRGCRRAALSGRGGGARRGRRSGRGGRGTRPGSAGSRLRRSAGRSPGARGRPCSRRTRPARRRSAARCSLQLPVPARPRRAPGRAATSWSAIRTVPPSIAQPVAVVEQLEEAGARGIDEADPGPGQHQRPRVGVLAVGGGRGVEHGGDPGRDQLLGRDPVDVEVVDDGDVARAQLLHQVLGALSQAGGPVDRRVRACPVATPEQSGEATATELVATVSD